MVLLTSALLDRVGGDQRGGATDQGKGQLMEEAENEAGEICIASPGRILQLSRWRDRDFNPPVLAGRIERGSLLAPGNHREWGD
jgi:hypothetical protein